MAAGTGLMLALAPRAATAQCIDCPGENNPPSVTIVSPSNGQSVTTRTITVRIQVWDDHLPIVSKSISVNGTPSYGSWTYVTGDANSETYQKSISLPLAGSNALHVDVVDNINQPASVDGNVILIDRLAPVVSTAPHNGEMRIASLCALDCFDATLSYSTPGYISVDAQRTATLLYRSSQAWPIATVTLDATDISASAASAIALKLRAASGAYVNFLGGRPEHFFARGTGSTRLTALFDASGLATGAYDYTAVVSTYWPDGAKQSTEVPVRVLVLNESNSSYGAGWTIAGIQSLFSQPDGGAVITDGTGSIVRFGPTTPGCTGSCTHAAPAGELTRLIKYTTPVNGLAFERQYADSGRATFDVTGRMLAYKDRFGNQISYTYVGTSRSVSTITDPASRAIVFGYNASNRLATITDPNGRVTTVTVNTANDVVDVRNPAWKSVIAGAYYGTQHRLSTWNDENGGTTMYYYDWTRQLNQINLPFVKIAGGAVVSPTTKLVAWQNAAAVWDTASNGTLSNPHASVVGDSLSAILTNPRGFKTTLYLNKLGQPLKIRDAVGRVERYSYTSAGQVEQQTMVDGSVTTYLWSGPRLYTRTQAAGTLTYYYQGAFPNLVTRIFDGVRDTRFRYDAAGCLIETTVGADTSHVKKSTFVCDSRGRVTVATDPSGHRTRTYFASTGLQNTDSVWLTTDTTVSYKRRVVYSRDSIGRIVATTDPLGRVARLRYDILNRDSMSIGPASDTTRMTYDGLGLHQVVDAKGQIYRFEKNAIGWDTLRVDPTGVGEGLAYDVMGNVVSKRNRRAQTTQFSYDTLGRMSTMTLADGRVTTYKYAANGLWMSVANPTSVDTIKLSADRRTLYESSARNGKNYLVTSYLINGVKTGMRFDFVGRQFARDQAMTFYYDSAGADPKTGLLYGLAQTGFGERRTNLVHNDDELISRVDLPIGAITQSVDKGYSALHDIVSENYTGNTNLDSLYGRGYSRDSIGRITSAFRPAGDKGRNFTYDPAGRISQYSDFTASTTPTTWQACPLRFEGGCNPAGTTSSPPVTLTYDAVGNRTDAGAIVQNGNRLTQIAGYTYTFDADGNVVTRRNGGVNTTQTFFWNSMNQLDSVSSFTGVIRFYYDGFGRRTRKVVPGFAWNYHYSGMQLYADSKDDGGVVHVYKYYPGTDDVVSVTDWDKTYHFVKDASGNVTGLINEETGAASNRYAYSPFGEIESSSEAFSNSIRFKGRYFDSETGLYENRARYYDPISGRFISQDPIGLAGGINPYAYASNDPVNMSDPTGMCTWVFKNETIIVPDVGPVEITVPRCELDPVNTTGKGPNSPPATPVMIGGSYPNGGTPPSSPGPAQQTADDMIKACDDAQNAAIGSFGTDFFFLVGGLEAQAGLSAASKLTGRLDVVRAAEAAARQKAFSTAVVGTASFEWGIFFNPRSSAWDFVPIIGSINKLFIEIQMCVTPGKY